MAMNRAVLVRVAMVVGTKGVGSRGIVTRMVSGLSRTAAVR